MSKCLSLISVKYETIDQVSVLVLPINATHSVCQSSMDSAVIFQLFILNMGGFDPNAISLRQSNDN